MIAYYTTPIAGVSQFRILAETAPNLSLCGGEVGGEWCTLKE